MNALTPWNSLRDFGLIPSRLFGLAETLFPNEAPKTWLPSVEVSETDDHYLVKAELPEVKNEDVKVIVREGTLTLKGERKYEKSTENEKVHIQERSYGSFLRTFSLPKDVDSENVKAEFKNGVLHISLPKKPEVKPREIEIKPS